MPVRPLILSPPIVLRALRGDPADLLVRAGGGQRRRALPALCALFSMTLPGLSNDNLLCHHEVIFVFDLQC